MKEGKFWRNIWDSKVHHRKDAEWFRELRACKDNRKQENSAIMVEMATQQKRKLPNWKFPGSDGVQGYRLKILTELHMRLNELLNKTNFSYIGQG